MKILFLALGSYKVKDTTGHDADNFDRQLLYAISLTRLSGLVANHDAEILVVDNTVSSAQSLHPPLQKALSLPKIAATLFSQDNALGHKNKGAGEYGMCRFALEKRRDLFEQADWVVYYTIRHTMPFPLIFEHLKKYPDYDAIVSSAEYFFPDGTMSVPGSEIFDDLIFAMKKQVFIKYIDSMDPELLVKKRLGSEQNLYQFLAGGSFNYKQVERFGVFRYDYVSNQMQVV
jgi:hypothetical protein